MSNCYGLNDLGVLAPVLGGGDRPAPAAAIIPSRPQNSIRRAIRAAAGWQRASHPEARPGDRGCSGTALAGHLAVGLGRERRPAVAVRIRAAVRSLSGHRICGVSATYRLHRRVPLGIEFMIRKTRGRGRATGSNPANISAWRPVSSTERLSPAEVSRRWRRRSAGRRETTGSAIWGPNGWWRPTGPVMAPIRARYGRSRPRFHSVPRPG
jgi:hypothetical protein